MKRTYIFLGLIILCFCFSFCNEPFKSNFESITGEAFPGDAQFTYTETSPTDFHGDYGSLSIVKVGSTFYQNLPDKLLQRGFVRDTTEPNFGEFENAAKEVSPANISSKYIFYGNNLYYYVGFLTDNESIILVRSSW